MKFPHNLKFKKKLVEENHAPKSWICGLWLLVLPRQWPN